MFDASRDELAQRIDVDQWTFILNRFSTVENPIHGPIPATALVLESLFRIDDIGQHTGAVKSQGFLDAAIGLD